MLPSVRASLNHSTALRLRDCMTLMPASGRNASLRCSPYLYWISDIYIIPFNLVLLCSYDFCLILPVKIGKIAAIFDKKRLKTNPKSLIFNTNKQFRQLQICCILMQLWTLISKVIKLALRDLLVKNTKLNENPLCSLCPLWLKNP